ncbi:glycosyl hydrolase family 18 protein [Chitinophaga arvensicola]|nr:glycosyl hydrolase family 18 protein [Chitinophaga arvensicola]
MKHTLTLCCLFLFLTTACAKKNTHSEPEPPGIRILGYFFSPANNWLAELPTIDLSKVTDINLAFVNPDASGTFGQHNTEALLQLTTKAHQQKVRVFFAIGGGDPPASFEPLLNTASRTAFINNIVNLAVRAGFDGVDVDLENTLITHDTTRYAAFVSELQAALHQKGKLITSAQVQWSSTPQFMSATTLNKFDYINIMSYDATGWWNPAAPGPHASYEKATGDFAFYRARGIPAEKLYVGVPFYGYAFGPGFPATDAGSTFTYRDLVTTYPNAAGSDAIVVKDKGTIYYNGTGTIEKKTAFVKSNGGAGIMIWHLQQDVATGDKNSLLNAIYNKARGK